MTKRSQSTGLPNAEGAKAPVTPAGTPAPRGGKALREYRSRAEREAEIQRMVVLGTGIAVALVAVVLVVALVYEFLINPNQAVAAVNGETITVAEFKNRVRLERGLINERLNDVIEESQAFGAQGEQYLEFRFQQEPFAAWLNEMNVADQLGNRVLNDMIEDELVRAKAEELGITVTDEQVEAQIQDFFEYSPGDETLELILPEATAEGTETAEPTATPTPFVSPTPSPAPTATPTPEVEPTATLTPLPTLSPMPTLSATERAQGFSERLESVYGAVRGGANVSQDAINEFFRMKALRAAVAEAVTAETLDTTNTEVSLRHILVATEEEANDVIAALEAGESFADLARAVSTDTGSAPNGGEYDWAPTSTYVGPFAEAAENAEIGEFYGPVQTDFGYHVIQVRGRRDVDMTEAEIEQERLEAFETYLDELRNAEGASVETFPIWTSNVPVEPVFRPRS